jgi:hypothetical protein
MYWFARIDIMKRYVGDPWGFIDPFQPQSPAERPTSVRRKLASSLTNFLSAFEIVGAVSREP